MLLSAHRKIREATNVQTVCYSVGSVLLQQTNQITPGQGHVCKLKHSHVITFVVGCGVDVPTYVRVRWAHELYEIYRVLL